MESKLGRMTLQAAGTQGIGALYEVGDHHVIRLYIRNIGGATAILALDSSSVDGLNGLTANSKQFPLPANMDAVIILMPRQKLFAVGAGAGVVVTWAASEALPLADGRPPSVMLP